MSAFGEEEDDVPPYYERKTLEDIQSVRQEPKYGISSLLEACVRFYAAFGSDEDIFYEFESLFPGFSFPSTAQFATELASSSTETRIRMSVIMVWFLWKSCSQLESWIWDKEEERNSSASAACKKYYFLLEKALRDFGWRRINSHQAEEKISKYLFRVESHVNRLIKADSDLNNYLKPS